MTSTADFSENVQKRPGDNLVNDQMQTDSAERDDKSNHALASRLMTTCFDMPNVDVFKSDLETLPNEVFFLLFSYMNQSDVVRAFFNLNRRIDLIVLECIRYLNVRKNTEFTWFVEHTPYIGSKIEMITCNVESVLYLFSSTHSYSNLHTVILWSRLFHVSLNVKDCSPLNIIISCLNILRLCGFWLEDDFEHPLLLRRSITMKTRNEKMSVLLSTAPCPAIQCISLRTDDEQMWVYLCNLAPNLNYIRIDHYETYDVQIRHHAVIASDTRLKYLTRLHINFDEYNTDFTALQWVVASCHSTLQDFQLTSEFSSPVSGRFLEELLHPCQHLKNLSFFIRTDQIAPTDIVEQLCQFQSEWWLDEGRPLVLVHCHRESFFIITSIPCTYKSEFVQLPIDPKTWLLNKENVDSPLFYFTKMSKIEFSNSSQQPVTLDFLYFINRIFRSGIEQLIFDYWGFSSPHTLFKQLINHTTNPTPVLPRLKRLDINLSNCDGSHGLTLMIWLILAPNIEELNLTEMIIDDKVKLATELIELLKTDKFLRPPIFDRLGRVKLFYRPDNCDSKMKQKLFLLFSEIFPKAIDFIRKNCFLVVSNSTTIKTNISYVPSHLDCSFR